MYYRNEIQRLLKDEKNIVNRMYLNEILLQVRKLEHAFSKSPEEEDYFFMMSETLSHFSQQLENPKYQYNRNTKNGFRKNSVVLSALYLEDFLDALFAKQKILKSKGVVWGRQSFSMNLIFNPYNLSIMEKDLCFDYKQSPQFLQLTQKLDFQFRITGKKVFQKFEVTFPLLIFFAFKNLYEEDLIKIEHYADKAKKSLSKSRIMIICEAIDPAILPEIKCSYIDNFFVLRKQKIGTKHNLISADVLKTIYVKINEYLYQGEEEGKLFEKVGYI